MLFRVTYSKPTLNEMQHHFKSGIGIPIKQRKSDLLESQIVKLKALSSSLVFEGKPGKSIDKLHVSSSRSVMM